MTAGNQRMAKIFGLGAILGICLIGTSKVLSTPNEDATAKASRRLMAERGREWELQRQNERRAYLVRLFGTYDPEIIGLENASIAGGGIRGEASTVFIMATISRAYPELANNPFAIHALMQGGMIASPKSLGIGKSDRLLGPVLFSAFGVAPGHPLDKMALISSGRANEMAGAFGATDNQMAEQAVAISLSAPASE